jgi:general secretion pathway protein D
MQPLDHPFRRVGAVVLLAATLAGCATGPGPAEPRDSMPSAPELDADRAGSQGPIDLAGSPEPDSEDAFSGSEQYPGSGVFINREAASRERPQPEGEGEITLNFEGQGIQEVVHAILGSLLEENYVIAPGVSGEVTFSTARPVARDQVLPILEMLLRWNGATLVWKEDRFHVLPISEAVRGNLTPRLAEGELRRGYQVLAVPLEYVSATQMQTLLEPYARDDAILSADDARSLMILAGTRAELRNYLQIVDTFDVDWLQGMSVGLFQIQRVEVADLVEELQELVGGDESPLAGMFRFMPLERLNSVVVITPNEHYLDRIGGWIDRLDRSSPEAGARLYVYRVKNLDAEVLAGYIADVFGGEGGGGGRATRREDRGSLAPGLEQASASSVSEFQNETGPQARERQSAGGGGGGGTVTLGEDGEVRITAVLETNSLLIQASPSDYDAILNAIERLDEEPLQVLIEAQVLVVALNDALQYGVSWFLANSQPGEDGFPGLPEGRFVESPAANNFQFGAGSNFLGAIAESVGDDFVSATINALESISDVRTISAPSLMVRNNSDARINVGTQVPIQSTSFTGNTNTVFGSTQFLNTGVILEVTPRVNPGGLVYLEVSQEVSSPGSPATEGGNPPINTRTIDTEVAVQSGQTIVLGGLIEETTTDSRSGVPFLQRIPGLGALFRSTTDDVSRSETLVLITPTVVESTARLEQISEEFGRRFRGLDPLRSNESRSAPDAQ